MVVGALKLSLPFRFWPSAVRARECRDVDAVQPGWGVFCQRDMPHPRYMKVAHISNMVTDG